jgi:transcriptional regulator with XRE-family HTH domain
MNTASCMIEPVGRTGVRRPQRQKSPLGELVRRRRVELKLSLRELADRASLAPAHISMIEHGERKNPRGKTLNSLAQALGMTVDELLAGAKGEPLKEPPGRRELEEFIRARQVPRATALALREAAQKLGPRPSELWLVRLLDLVTEELRSK